MPQPTRFLNACTYYRTNYLFRYYRILMMIFK